MKEILILLVKRCHRANDLSNGSNGRFVAVVVVVVVSFYTLNNERKKRLRKRQLHVASRGRLR